MIKALRVAMIVWSAIAILVGLAYIFFPSQLKEMGGFEEGPAYVEYILALVGICFIAAGVFVILAARDPQKHIMWVQFAIVVAILIVVAAVTSIVRGLVTFRQEGALIIFNAIFAVIFLALYPRRKAQSSKQTTS